jgi:hypothetical protein
MEKKERMKTLKNFLTAETPRRGECKNFVFVVSLRLRVSAVNIYFLLRASVSPW